jgi:Holliday junction DNA helicase RuvA
MIASITGVVQKIEGDSLIVLVGGVGLRIRVPTTVLETVEATGRGITLHTHLHWREKDIALYGFASASVLELFEMLLGVSGVGPRLAVAVISTLSPDVLTGAVAREEPGALERVPGIGRKTAQRIMFHLRDKFKVDLWPAGVTMLTDVDADVIAALTALGYSLIEAQTAVQKLPRDSSPELEDRVRLALGILGG